jgi:hypothetical protein
MRLQFYWKCSKVETGGQKAGRIARDKLKQRGKEN